LLTRHPRIDFILVYPDTLLRGAAAALMERKIRVPRDVTVMSHRNVELPIYVPFPVFWLSVQIEDFGKALPEQITDQASNAPARAFKIPIRVDFMKYPAFPPAPGARSEMHATPP